jgi:hypothetical protein
MKLKHDVQALSHFLIDTSDNERLMEELNKINSPPSSMDLIEYRRLVMNRALQYLRRQRVLLQQSLKSLQEDLVSLDDHIENSVKLKALYFEE